MSELDVILHESLGRLAEPGDPTGVAEAIRARVEGVGSSGDGSIGDGGSDAGGARFWSGPGGTFWSGPGVLGILIGLSVDGGVLGLPDAPPNPPAGAGAIS